MKIYGIYEADELEQCIFVGTMEEIEKFTGMNRNSIGSAINRDCLINGRYKVKGLYFERSKNVVNPKRKGARGERELASKLREYGYNCRRGQQYNGLEGEDVVGLDYIHIECKRVEKLNLEEALKQAKRDCKDGKIPAVFHRRNNESWKVTMPLDDWISLYNEYYSSMKLKEEK